MEDAGLRDWPPGLPYLRLACEECHKRKIRCEAHQDGSQGSCQACHANRRTCLFSLKNKTGRPRKPKPAPVHQTSKPLSPRPPASQARPRSPPATMAGPGPYEMRRDSAREQPLSALRSAMPGHYADQPPFDSTGPEPCNETHQKQLSWLTAIATVQNGFDLLPNSPSGGELSASPGLGHYGDDFLLEMPESATTQPALSSISHNEQHGVFHGEPPNPASLWATTPSTGESSSGGSSRGPKRIDPARNGAGGLEGNGNTAMSGDFFSTMRLCSEMNNRHQSKVLDVMAKADEQELSTVLGNIEELGHKTVAAMRDVAGHAGPSSRQGQYNWMLTRVAVMGAVDIAADLVEHNLAIHKIKAPAVCEADIEDGSSLMMVDPTAATPGRREDRRENASSGAPADSLGSVLWLVRLDYALLQFSLFFSAEQCDMDGCSDPVKGISRPGCGCPRSARTSTLARMARVRTQVWGLAEGIRRLW